MNALNTVLLITGSVAFVAAFTHLALGLLLRKDRTHLGISLASFGFGSFAVGAAFVSTLEPAARFPFWVLVGLGQLLVTLGVPTVSWLLLEVPLTLPRRLYMVAMSLVGVARAVELPWRAVNDPLLSWETVHAEPGVMGVVSGIAAFFLAAAWILEGALAIPARRPFARGVLGFGVLSSAATLQGALVTLGVPLGPAAFGFAGLPFVAFMNIVVALRHVRAIEEGQKPAGDFERYTVLERLGEGGMGEVFLARRRGPAGFLRDVVLKTLKAQAERPPRASTFSPRRGSPPSCATPTSSTSTTWARTPRASSS